MKRLLYLIATLFAGLRIHAHDVVWLENPNGLPALFAPPISFDVYPADLFADDAPNVVISIVPDAAFLFGFPVFEPCTVYVTIDPPASPYLGVEILPNGGIFDFKHMIPPILPALEVDVVVYLKNIPPDGKRISTEITGEWHASGQPDPPNCTAVNPNPFIVPIEVDFSPLGWLISLLPSAETVEIDTHKDVALQTADSVDGSYLNVGIGHLFSIAADAAAQFCKGSKKLGGSLAGKVADGTGNPQTNITVGMPQGGRTATPDNKGGYALRLLPFGDTIIQFIKSVTLQDPQTGATNKETATWDLVVPTIKAYGTLDVRVEMQVFKLPLCNCSPWCSIGFATLDGVNTAIYYSGGANKPKGIPSDCDQPVVTITPPNGKAFNVKPGGGRHQNSGLNPAPGTWTVTTTVCGQSKSCSITYP